MIFDITSAILTKLAKKNSNSTNIAGYKWFWVKKIIFDQTRVILTKLCKKIKIVKHSWIQVVLGENDNISPN